MDKFEKSVKDFILYKIWPGNEVFNKIINSDEKFIFPLFANQYLNQTLDESEYFFVDAFEYEYPIWLKKLERDEDHFQDILLFCLGMSSNPATEKYLNLFKKIKPNKDYKGMYYDYKVPNLDNGKMLTFVFNNVPFDYSTPHNYELMFTEFNNAFEQYLYELMIICACSSINDKKFNSNLIFPSHMEILKQKLVISNSDVPHDINKFINHILNNTTYTVFDNKHFTGWHFLVETDQAQYSYDNIKKIETGGEAFSFLENIYYWHRQLSKDKKIKPGQIELKIDDSKSFRGLCLFVSPEFEKLLNTSDKWKYSTENTQFKKFANIGEYIGTIGRMEGIHIFRCKELPSYQYNNHNITRFLLFGTHFIDFCTSEYNWQTKFDNKEQIIKTDYKFVPYWTEGSRRNLELVVWKDFRYHINENRILIDVAM